MPVINGILEECYQQLSLEYEIEKVDSLPVCDKRKKASVPVWHLIIQANAFGKLEDVDVYVAFPNGFPYDMPWVIVIDERLRFLPHISFKNRKICLYEDGTVYDTSNVVGLVRDNITRARRWIERYSNQDNTAEYAEEIDSYWAEQYDYEKELDPYWTVLGAIPDKTCELKAVTYPVDYLGKKDKYFDRTIVCTTEESEKLLENIYSRYKSHWLSVLFIKSFSLPTEPPYSLTGRQFIERIADKEDKRFFAKYINKHREAHLLIPLGLDYLLGGLTIPKLSVFRAGFRKGSVTALDVLTNYEYRNKNLARMRASVYEKKRIAERSAGAMMQEQSFVVVGLGSVGSNLCYYLNGYNNAKFTLIDSDKLNTYNIGRHLLGFRYMDQKKVQAVKDYLVSYRPDRDVKAKENHLEDAPSEVFIHASALFLCTGDVMSEKWILDKMTEGEVKIPTFLLWLEPYGVSGIMVYVNPSQTDKLKTLVDKVNDSFLDYCLIDRNEYQNGENLSKRDAGCNGKYALYSANDVTLFLSAMFPHIDRLLSNPEETQIYRWVGNVEIARQKGLHLNENAGGLSKNNVQCLMI
ncbi:MAG: ThiF family adenylyltransferase [Bacteroidales bacterium]|nr:ThiF family adenylyltransferase [Bacteroidales bacterium]